MNGHSNDRVLVTDGDRRQAIVAIRNLGHHGVDVTAGSSEWICPGGRSKYATGRLRSPSPDANEPRFVESLKEELRSRRYDALIPVTSPTVGHVVRNRDRLERHVRSRILPTRRCWTVSTRNGLSRPPGLPASPFRGRSRPRRSISISTRSRRRWATRSW